MTDKKQRTQTAKRHNFRKLKIYQRAISFAVEIYRLSSSFPKEYYRRAQRLYHEAGAIGDIMPPFVRKARHGDLFF